MKFFTIILVFLLNFCTLNTNTHDEFVNNINGPYQLFHDVTASMNVSPVGNIEINGLTVYNISLVLNTNSAIYQVTGTDGFIPVRYATDILYIGQTNQSTNDLNFNEAKAFAVKI